MTQTAEANTKHHPFIIWNAIAAGLATTVAMWLAWFILHHPAVGVPPSTSGIILLAVQTLALAVFAARWLHAPLPKLLTLAVLAALFSATINLVSMGSMLVPQADPSQGMQAQAVPASGQPSLPLMVIGYLAVSTALGLVSGALAHFLRSRPSPAESDALTPLRRLAFALMAATLPLLLLGGLVTSYRAGLSVPDWPGTYGGNMFLYPISLMASDKQVYLEHSHRLFGALVGLSCIVVTIATFRLDPRGWTRGWACAILALVVLQGVLGGFRVTEESKYLAAAHGVLAQVVFLMMGMFAGYVTLGYRQGPTEDAAGDKRRRSLCTGGVHALILQLIFGALYRHTGSSHALYTHIAFSFVIVGFGMMAGMSAAARPGPTDAFNRALRRTGGMVAAIVTLQFILGWGAWAANPPSAFKPVPRWSEMKTLEPVPAWKAAIRTGHQANGALLIGTTGVLFVLARRLRRGNDGAAVPNSRTSPPALSATAAP